MNNKDKALKLVEGVSETDGNSVLRSLGYSISDANYYPPEDTGKDYGLVIVKNCEGNDVEGCFRVIQDKFKGDLGITVKVTHDTKDISIG